MGSPLRRVLLLSALVVSAGCAQLQSDDVAASSTGVSEPTATEFDDVRDLANSGTAPATTSTSLAAMAVEVELVEATVAEERLPDLAFSDFDRDGFVGPHVVYGRDGDPDPFATGDLHLTTVIFPHEDDSHVVDGSTEGSVETEIAGRTAQVIPWRTSDDDTLGHEILWDLDPDHIVLARSRSMPLDALTQLLSTMQVVDGAALVDHGSAGLSPMAVSEVVLQETGRRFAHLAGERTTYRLAADDGRIAELTIRVLDGSEADITALRFLAGSERSVSVDGAPAFVLDGLGHSIDDTDTAVVWMTTDRRLVVAGVDEPGFAEVLPDLLATLDIGA